MKCVSAFALAVAMAAVGQAQNQPQPNPQGNPQDRPQTSAPNVAQNRISGSLQCGKPDPQHSIAVGDRPGHSFGIEQVKCAWTKPVEIAGISSKDGVSTVFSENMGSNSRILGYHVTNMANGDSFFVRYQGTAALKDGVPQSEEGRWSFGSSSGKLKGLRGQGTYKCTASPEGATCTIEGEYLLPK